MRAAMMLAALALLLAVSGGPAIARPHPAPAATPAPLPPEDPAISKIAFGQFLAWQIGKVDRSRYTDAVDALMTPDTIAAAAQDLVSLGALQRVVWKGPSVAQGVPAGSKTYLYQVICSDGQVYMQFSIGPNGKLASMVFRKTLLEIGTPSD
ncbi:MAG TPA: hypothetical protein VIJ12_07355 [Candidatus Baltobacteraceae bacterium]